MGTLTPNVSAAGDPGKQHDFRAFGNLLVPVIPVNIAIDRNCDALFDAFVQGRILLRDVLQQLSDGCALELFAGLRDALIAASMRGGDIGK